MKIQQLQYAGKSWKIHLHAEDFDRMQCQLVLVFGEASLITDTAVFNYLERSYPEAHIILSSSPGSIINCTSPNNSVVVTAIQFDNITIHCAETYIYRHQNYFSAGYYLLQQLQQSDLSAAFIVSDSTCSDNSELLSGFNKNNTQNIPVLSGLAGDSSQFPRTCVGVNQLPAAGVITAIGFYGPPIDLGSLGRLYDQTMTVSAFTEI
ncbi:FIST N-terminal domain-containing protein [Niastella populi]|uniref:FIST domain-containing protein n=1 Tax=Niastella populi TaxID=550983 RepID=A0A1V9EKS0_9BACT|nr:FIST N-terminal domain-containing protein [Niastella populi]OQP46661.1 hypothetical protein A4R26_08030 [Niastella populi]